MKQVLAVIGGRSELARMGPALRAIRDQYPSLIRPRMMYTGEKPQMVWSTGAMFGLVPERHHALPQETLSLADLSWQISNAVGHELDSRQTDLVIVQGISMTAVLAGQQAFLRQIPLIHIDGFTANSSNAESSMAQSNRRMLAALASFRCVPHRGQAEELRRLGVPAYEVGVTGSTAVEVAQMALAGGRGAATQHLASAARRTSGLFVGLRDEETSRDICSEVGFALATIAHDHPEIPIRLLGMTRSVHKGLLPSILGSLRNVEIINPKDYLGYLRMLGASSLILTNAEDVAEEGLAMRRPVVFMQQDSQPLHHGVGFAITSVPPTQDSIVSAVEMVLAEHCLSNGGVSWPAESPIGDGKASLRLVRLLSNWARNRVLTAHSFEAYDGRFQTKGVTIDELSTPLMH